MKTSLLSNLIFLPVLYLKLDDIVFSPITLLASVTLIVP